MSLNERLIEKFTEMDLDQNGELTPNEVKYILQQDGKFSKESVEKKIIKRILKNPYLNRNYIDFMEFIKRITESENGTVGINKEIIKEFDINSDGKITLDEYKEKLNIVDPVGKRFEIWKNVFDSFDLDHSGGLELEEIQKIIANDGVGNGYDVSTFENWLSKRDMNRDGKLDYNEFLKFINPSIE